jgi:hypothetical protein
LKRLCNLPAGADQKEWFWLTVTTISIARVASEGVLLLHPLKSEKEFDFGPIVHSNQLGNK